MTEEPRTVENEEADTSGEEADGSRKVVRLSVGQELTGTIKQVTEFGAFVDIGAGRDGLVHISELSVGRVTNVKDFVEEGQTVTVWIKRLNRERNRISLTMISPDTKTIRDLQEGEIVEGVVSRMVPYGAFIDIGVGTDALLIGDYPSPRTYGTYPTILAEYVREEGSMTLAEAVRKMTSFAAARLGIPDRGMLRDGMKADVVVFDPKTVKSPATRHEPKQFPVGIDYVLVNGRIVVDQSEHTGVLAGRALRRGRAAT